MSNTITIEAIDGPPIRTVTHQGQRFVGGDLGQRYQIRIEAETRRHLKFLAVVTVDGRNVVDGSPGSRKGAGMVATGSCVLDGWRMSLAEVRAFRICQGQESYSAGTDGSVANIGIIGVAMFRERRRDNYRGGGALESMGPMRGATRSAGTAMGESVTSRVTTTEFEREAEPFEVITICYDTTEALIEAGILPSSPRPEAFPADVMATPAFCQVPD